MHTYDIYFKTGPQQMERTEEPIYRQDLERIYRVVRRIEAASLDQVWQAMQAENWSPDGQAGPLVSGLGILRTSMCVGDLAISVETGHVHEAIDGTSWVFHGKINGYKLNYGNSRAAIDMAQSVAAAVTLIDPKLQSVSALFMVELKHQIDRIITKQNLTEMQQRAQQRNGVSS